MHQLVLPVTYRRANINANPGSNSDLNLHSSECIIWLAALQIHSADPGDEMLRVPKC